MKAVGPYEALVFAISTAISLVLGVFIIEPLIEWAFLDLAYSESAEGLVVGFYWFFTVALTILTILGVNWRLKKLLHQ